MSATTGAPKTSLSRWRPWGRAAGVLVFVALAVSIAASDALHDLLTAALRAAEPIVARRSLASACAFSGLAALSAMVAFFSSALLVPIAIHVWGELATLLLLWLGWFVGALGAFALGRGLGRPLARRVVGPDRLTYLETRVGPHSPFRVLLLLQLALPSEIPGYVLGALRCRLRTFLAAVALAELPYAIGTVYLGEALLRRQVLPLIALGVIGIAFLVWIHRWLERTLHRSADGDRPVRRPAPPAGTTPP